VINNIKSISLSKKNIVVSIILAMFLLIFAANLRASAFQCPDGGPKLPEQATIADCPSTLKDTPIDTDCNGIDENNNSVPLDKGNCGIVNLIVIGINFLSAIAGIVFVLSIMISGFQYMTGRDNSGQIQKAKSRIVWTLIAVAIFIFMYALLEFLVPGGIFPI
jgi:hypothetical protein